MEINNCHILIVDESSSVQETLKRYLHQLGARTTALDSAVRAINLIQADNVYNLIIASDKMAVMSDFNLSEWLGESQFNIPLIITTEDPDNQELISRIKEKGVFGPFNKKPFNFVELKKCIENI